MSNSEIDPKNLDNVFFISVECTADTPMSGVMSAFGLVNAGTKDTLYARLYVTRPDPENPESQVVERYSDGDPITDMYTIINRGAVTRYPVMRDTAAAVLQWMVGLTPEGCRPILLSDNIVSDAMWFNCFTDAVLGSAVFLDTSYDIADYYSGSLGAHIASSHLWDDRRKESDTNYPVEVAMSNARELRYLLGIDVRDPDEDDDAEEVEEGAGESIIYDEIVAPSAGSEVLESNT